jgi:NAD(P)H dehydrogenase (quinone)
MTRIAVVYYSATGQIYEMAEAVAQGAKDAGAEVRLRRVAELTPERVIRRKDDRREEDERTVPLVAEASLDDLRWADGFAFGSPTRLGLPAAELEHFIDQTGPLSDKGRLANKVATSFTSSQQADGAESTVLALSNVFYHWGCLILPPGYTYMPPVVAAAGSEPDGAAPAGAGDALGAELANASHHQGQRLAHYAGRLVTGDVGPPRRPDGASPDPLVLARRDAADVSPFTWQARYASP